MNISFSNEDLVFQKEVRDWMEIGWPQDMRQKQARSLVSRLSKADLVSWQKRLAKKGWAATNWPVEFGGAGFTPMQNYIFELEKSRVGAPGVVPFGITMVAPVIMKYGTIEQQEEFLPKILNSDIWFCQGYSEPGSGSDLASLNTKASIAGDSYVINGVKTWTTMAQYADWMFCLVRTSNEDIPQKGISFLLVDMTTPGISVKPIVTLDNPPSGEQEINMVYFEDVIVPRTNLLGEEGSGWTCAKYLLEFERGSAYSPALNASLNSIECISRALPGSESDFLWEDKSFRMKVNELRVQVKAMEALELRILGALSSGENVGPESSMLKTRGTELQQSASELSMELLADFSMPFDQSSGSAGDNFIPITNGGPNGASQHYFNTRKVSIYAGSNEIQRNIMSKMVLGL